MPSANQSSALPFGAHFTLLRPIPVVQRKRLKVFNFDGLRRCAVCLCLQTDVETHQERCTGLAVRCHGFDCTRGCGLWFASARGAALHITRCEGRSIAIDSYHSCGVVGDPVWLGHQPGPPNLAVSYIRWCRELGLTVGGVPGEMPASVPDFTISVLGDSGVVTTEPELLAQDCDYSGGDLSAISSSEDDNDTTVSQDSNSGISRLRDVRSRLSNAGITFDAFEATPCEGVIWRHGYFDCPQGTIITVETGHVRSASSRKSKTVKLYPFCSTCASLATRIRKWVSEGKFTPSGIHLCRRPTCREPVEALWHCRYHADQATRLHRTAEVRRGLLKTQSPAEILRFLSGTSLRPRRLVSPEWCHVKKAIFEGGRLEAFFVDVEAVYNRLHRRYLVCEIAVRDCTGVLALHCTVDHGLTFAELKAVTDSNMHAKLNQIYDFSSTDARTKGMRAEEVAARLRQLGFSPVTKLVEWSLNGFDLRALCHLLSPWPDVLPQRPLLGHRLWRELGLEGSVALWPLFASMFPGSNLNRTHHHADIDSEKLYIITRYALGLFSSS
ncbi:uncharacterized protein CCOS01_08489 [Colletotrichum costaricense]|uniref:Rhodanese domain-containing protein n=1 Tax=Colletotrichum costaricense TaxID=1209916 RepID=A0AAI9YVI8_9PEZI|nr:uncharacterized protein CCOS01_08489 [Colletotrichum costaricense]KAK1526071.1 hypothetical protein CCOS01_08489 [Colletotrichum costaricense]